MEWVPEYYEDVNDLPEDMPEDLKTYVKSIPAKEVGILTISNWS